MSDVVRGRGRCDGSTGIGAATALRLADEGFHVFAGVRREADADFAA